MHYSDWNQKINDVVSSIQPIIFKNTVIDISEKNDNFRIVNSVILTKNYTKRDFLGYLRAYNGPGFTCVVGAIEWNHYVNISNVALADLKINIYPNPSYSVLNVDFDNQIDAKFSMYNLLGQSILEYDFVPEKIDISKLNNGVYIIRISTSNGAMKVLKFIKED